jgi:hypothetical protein
MAIMPGAYSLEAAPFGGCRRAMGLREPKFLKKHIVILVKPMLLSLTYLI